MPNEAQGVDDAVVCTGLTRASAPAGRILPIKNGCGALVSQAILLGRGGVVGGGGASACRSCPGKRHARCLDVGLAKRFLQPKVAQRIVHANSVNEVNHALVANRVA